MEYFDERYAHARDRLRELDRTITSAVERIDRVRPLLGLETSVALLSLRVYASFGYVDLPFRAVDDMPPERWERIREYKYADKREAAVRDAVKWVEEFVEGHVGT